MYENLALGALADTMGITIIEFGPGRVVATMPVEGNTQPFGLLHGGANAVLAETVGSICAFLDAGGDKDIVGLDISCTHHRGKRDGQVTAVATPISIGRTITCHDIRISDEDGRPVASARLTCMLRERSA